jgi:hypothetical protein
MPIKLAEATTALDGARAVGEPLALARALVAWAEAAPVFRYRGAPVRDALVEASRLLAGRGDHACEGRCLLRLGQVQLESAEPGQAEQLAAEAAAAFQRGGDEEGVFRARVLGARTVRRLGDREAADRRLVEVASLSPRFGSKRAMSITFAEFTHAVSEPLVEAQDPDAIPTLRALLNGLDEARAEAFDLRFAAHQGIALVAELDGKPEAALIHLRAVTSLVKAHDAPLDLVECRVALGANLAANHQLDEARRVLQAAIDSSHDLGAGAESHRLIALTSLAAVLSERGAVKGAVDRALEAVSGYGNAGDPLGYVRGATLAAQILLAHGREAAGLELLMYGESALRQVGRAAESRLLKAQIDALHEQYGEEKFERLCREILDARAARKRLAEER